MKKIKVDREMFYFVGDFLKNNGYHRFMQPDFSKSNKECTYVMNAWKAPQQLMLGFGPGAHTHHFGGHIWANVYSIKKYINALKQGYFPGIMGVEVSSNELKHKYMVLGARALSISKKIYKRIFEENINDKFHGEIKKLIKLGWVKEEDDNYKLTEEGLYYVDNISKTFFSSLNEGKGQPWLKGLYNFIPRKFYKITKI